MLIAKSILLAIHEQVWKNNTSEYIRHNTQKTEDTNEEKEK